MNRKGFTLIEVLAVLLIIGVLATIGIKNGSVQIAHARMKTASGDMQMIASDIEKAVLDLNFLDVNDTEETALRYFRTWDSKYLSCPLNLDTMTFTPAGISGGYGTYYQGYLFRTSGYADPWDGEYRIYYLIPTEGENYRIIIASAGPNGQFAAAAKNAYVTAKENGYDDDVLLIMEPRI